MTISRDGLIRDLRKKFSNIIPSEEEMEIPSPQRFLTTGNMLLDWALGGGFPRGQISHIYGTDGGGKTVTMITQTIAAQKNPLINGLVLYVATEPKIDPSLFSALGVDMTKIIFARTRDKDNVLDGNKAINMIREAIGEVELIVLDSVAGLAPGVMYDMQSEDIAFAQIAKLLAYQLPIIANKLCATDTALILLNQERMSMSKWGKETKPFAGKALAHWVSMRAWMRSGGWVKRGKETVGFTPKLTVEKNDFAPPRREIQWDFFFDSGPDMTSIALEFAKDQGLVSFRGGIKMGEVSFNHPGERTIEDAKIRLRSEPELAELLFNAIAEL